MSFEAQWGPSDCGECEHPVKKGQMATYNDRGEICHVICPDIEPPKPAEICTSCFMEIPRSGVHDCDD